MKNVFMTVIRRGGYDLTGMLKRIDEYHIGGKLTDAEHDELVSAARGDAKPTVDASDEVQRLWEVVKDLSRRVTVLEGGVGDGGSASGGAADYVQPTGAHDAYYVGAVVSYKSKTYRCIAAGGVACVWSPDVMPSMWEEV